MGKTIYGRCALCKKEAVELQQSHIIPKAAYKRAKKHSNSHFRNYYEPKIIYQDGEKKHMLCKDCEKFFSAYETKFCNHYLDKYLKNANTGLPDITENVTFYFLTVSWRILYDDLYVFDSYKDQVEREVFEEYEQKLWRYLYSNYLILHPEETKNEPVVPLDFSEKTFGEMIAEFEKQKKASSLEDLSEIKHYVYTLNELGFTQDVADFFDSMIWGYSFCDATRTKYYIISAYKGIVIATVYHRNRSILITNILSLLWKSCTSQKHIKKEIVSEIHHLLKTMAEKHDEVQRKLDKNGLRENIAKKFES